MGLLLGLPQDLLVLGCLCFHVWYAPYTKVEESFNLHATHDILLRGFSPKSLRLYDHFQFPGVVPRSFIGSIVLAALSRPCMAFGTYFGVVKSKRDLQVLVRIVLAVTNGMGLCLLRRTAARQFGGFVGLVFALLTVSQYHVPFWAGRPLPNMFAFLPVNVAFYMLMLYQTSGKRSYMKSAISLLTFSTVAMRAELLALLCYISMQLLLADYGVFFLIVQTGIISAVLSLGITVVVDSYFWAKWPLWPELQGLIFNVVEGKSSEWGVSPVHTYFAQFLPRMLLGALPLSILGIVADPRIRRLAGPCLAFIAALSSLGHKEWRFVVYTVPVFNLAAARGAGLLVTISRTYRTKALVIVGLCGILAANIMITLMFTRASQLNYAGGEALNGIHDLVEMGTSRIVNIHVDNLAAQTGASLFLQLQDPTSLPATGNLGLWTYNKSETLSDFSDFTHVIREDISSFVNPSVLAHLSLKSLPVTQLRFSQIVALDPALSNDTWKPLAYVLAFDGWGRYSALRLAQWKHFIRVPMVSQKLWILEKADAI